MSKKSLSLRLLASSASHSDYINLAERNAGDVAASRSIAIYETKRLIETRGVQIEFIDKGAIVVKNCIFAGLYEGNGVRNRDRSQPYRRYDGAQFLASLDGYISPDMMFCGDSLPNSLLLDNSGCATLNGDFDALPVVAEPHIFLGTFHSHFGHALVESLARLWYLLELPYSERKRKKYVFFGGWGDSGGPVAVILEMLGVPRENYKVIRNDVVYKELLVPTFSWRPWNDWSIKVNSSLYSLCKFVADEVCKGVKSNYGRKIYLSREGLNEGSSSFNRRELGRDTSLRIEEISRQNDFSIVYPERLSLHEQIAMISEAEIIVGPSGSAQHLSAFATANVSQLILTHRNFWMGSTDAVFGLDRRAELMYLFGWQSKVGNPLTTAWDVCADDFEKCLEIAMSHQPKLSL